MRGAVVRGWNIILASSVDTTAKDVVQHHDGSWNGMSVKLHHRMTNGEWRREWENNGWLEENIYDESCAVALLDHRRTKCRIEVVSTNGNIDS